MTSLERLQLLYSYYADSHVNLDSPKVSKQNWAFTTSSLQYFSKKK